MSFLHCHNPLCDFSQDDFWSPDGWNPIKSILDKKHYLFRDDFYEECGLDKNWKEEVGYKRDQVVTNQEFVAHEFERHALRIREMKYRTLEEFRKKNPEGICPKCGKKELDID